jgi:hypothetical protein
MAILKGRQQGHPDKPFALFLILMRVNSLLAVHVGAAWLTGCQKAAVSYRWQLLECPLWVKNGHAGCGLIVGAQSGLD